MIHEMNLHHQPFEAIKNKEKNIEMRLYDDKRRKIKLGDTIIFTDIDTKEQLTVAVLDLAIFKDFDELYSNFDKTQLGYKKDEQAKASDMNIYYPQDKIETYGTLAIKIEVID